MEEVVFYGLSYGDSKTSELEIENCGDGLLEFEINKVKSGENISQVGNWIKIEPLRGVVKAGEKTNITFTVTINQKEA